MYVLILLFIYYNAIIKILIIMFKIIILIPFYMEGLDFPPDIDFKR